MIVADASVLAPFLVDAGPDGRRTRARLRGERLAGPDLARVETLSVIRRHLLHGRLDSARARDAVEDLSTLPLRDYPTAPLLPRAWELRANLSAYDACYVALAETLGCTLLTSDGRLARAPGTRCTIELV
ncbi:MAG: PIN domain-containing protein [Acidimicrobiia bacterium]|nr:PIN domain-containing protein [Acidimicrobiia bacterium]